MAHGKQEAKKGIQELARTGSSPKGIAQVIYLLQVGGSSEMSTAPHPSWAPRL